jgi:transposase
MEKHSEVFVGLDVAKAKNAVAIAEGGRNGEVRYLGEIENTAEATRRLIAKLSKTYTKLTFCYEAGPTGYGLFRWIGDLGHECIVVAPSLIPMKAGDRVKTNRRDAENLAKLLRAGELTAVWVPDARHEAMRDLVRAREAAAQDQTRKRQQVTSFLLRYGRIYLRKKTWGATHARWLTEQTFDHVEQRIAFEELAMAARQASERVARLEAAIAELVPKWSMAPLVEALQAMRGIDLVAASILMAELGDLTRFDSPRQLMGFLGLVPSERSTGDSVRRGGITKTGNTRARRVLIESAWSYRLPPDNAPVPATPGSTRHSPDSTRRPARGPHRLRHNRRTQVLGRSSSSRVWMWTVNATDVMVEFNSGAIAGGARRPLQNQPVLGGQPTGHFVPRQAMPLLFEISQQRSVPASECLDLVVSTAVSDLADWPLGRRQDRLVPTRLISSCPFDGKRTKNPR